MRSFEVESVAKRLARAGGGYEVVQKSQGLEVGVYVLIAPAPDDQKPHRDDEVYLVLDGAGTITVDGEEERLEQGQAVFVAAEAEHRFSDYEALSLLVVFTGAGAPPLRGDREEP